MTRPRIKLFSWNPRRPLFRGRIGRHLKLGSRVNNFGDLLGPILVRRLLDLSGLKETAAPEPGRLLSVGSILHYAQAGDVVWGSGVNGKRSSLPSNASRLRVCAVRGPRSAEILKTHGLSVPEIYGDPALLLPYLFPEFVEASREKRHRVTIIPNLNDVSSYAPSADLVSPTSDLWMILRRIAQSELVVGSSLHAVIVAEALGVPARVICSEHELSLKYEDYYEGSGRTSFHMAPTLREALDLGGEPLPLWNPAPLLSAFPADLWGGSVPIRTDWLPSRGNAL
jgi:pyruvyltransferase